MPNDAKLGLLVGVLGVIMAAVLSVKSPVAQGTPSAQVAPAAAAAPKEVQAVKKGTTPETGTPAALPAELASTPVTRSKKEIEGTPTSRASRDDEE
jgi:hypothetical protein